MRLTLALIGLLILSLPAHAEPRMISGGIICDSLEDVERLIRREPQATCGRLVGAFPAEVTMLEPFEHNGLRFHMARYDFLRPVPWGNQTQFGFWGAPEPIRKPGELDA